MEERNLMKRVGIVWPNQADRGTHVNVSGGGLVKTVITSYSIHYTKLYEPGPEQTRWCRCVALGQGGQHACRCPPELMLTPAGAVNVDSSRMMDEEAPTHGVLV